MNPRRAFVLLVVLGLTGCAHRRTSDEANYPYVEPLSSPGAKMGGLPPAVRQTIRAQTGAAQIHTIVKTEDGGRMVYHVMYDDALRFPPLHVAQDGSVLYPDLTVAVGAGEDDIGITTGSAVSGVPPGDLPVNVLKTIQREVPTAEIDVVIKITSGDLIYYEVSFKGRSPEFRLLISESGAVLQGRK
jgi:hypothetical protein